MIAPGQACFSSDFHSLHCPQAMQCCCPCSCMTAQCCTVRCSCDASRCSYVTKTFLGLLQVTVAEVKPVRRQGEFSGAPHRQV